MSTENKKEASSHRALAKTARKKLDRSLPLDWDERVAMNLGYAYEASKRILGKMIEDLNENDGIVRYTQGNYSSVRNAIRQLVVEMYLLAASAANKRQELEERVKKLHGRIIDLEERGVKGLFDPTQTYRAFDVVALGGASFMAKHDNPGPCPGDGWQLSAAQGKRGKPGPRVRSLTVDGQGMLTLTNDDGSTVKCDLYPVLNKVQRA